MAGAGDRHRLIRFLRKQTATDDHGGEAETGAPQEIARAWVRVRYGSGQERREAAQERADQVATFECLFCSEVEAVLITDLIGFDGVSWDITNRALVGLNREIHFTAVRTA